MEGRGRGVCVVGSCSFFFVNVQCCVDVVVEILWTSIPFFFLVDGGGRSSFMI